jgi:CHAD domain-containing protein
MPTRPADSLRKNAPPEALDRFLGRVLQEHAVARNSLAPDSVHDLRVALRRSRSLAEGFATLDDDRDWRRVRKSAKKLQSGLAKLRDAQVMTCRIQHLRFTGGKAGAAVTETLERDERKGKSRARRAIREFPRRRWKRWRRRLPKRAQRLGTAPVTFTELVLERLQEAAARERRWRATESQVAAHSLRIAVKHFRYTVQSFLPQQYASWERDLKRMQDALGDIHDLDVLRGWLLRVGKEKSLDSSIQNTWLRRITAVREERVERYKKAVSVTRKQAGRGKHAPLLWDRWRREIERLAELNVPNYGEVSA